MWTDQSSGIIRFGVFELDIKAGELRRNGIKIKLQEQPLQVLVTLLEHPGQVVSREELRTALWPADTFVDFDHSLNAAIKRLRDALGESADQPVFIETMARRGYRFIGPVPASGLGRTAERTGGRKMRLRFSFVGMALLVALLLGLNAGGWRERIFLRITKPKIQAIAVLPLANLSRDPEQNISLTG